MPDFTGVKVWKAPGDNTGVGTPVFEVDAISGFAKVTTPGKFMVDSNIVPDKESRSVLLLVGTLSNYVWFINEGVWQVDHVVADQSVAGGAGATVTVVVCAPTVVVASGTVQLTAAIDLATAGNNGKSVRGTLIASPTRAAAGDRIGYVMAGTLTALVGNLTIGIKRVA